MENNIEIDIDIKEYFEGLLLKSGFSVDNEKKEKMLKFLELLYEKNKVMNLTAIRDKKGMIEKHFIDSLFLTEIIKKDEQKLIDMGTGAGFPGLVLAIYYPEKEFLLVDSVRKKIEFINEVIENLELKNVKTSSERAEELIKNKRETFDTALCRGVANLRIILEYMIPFIKVGGKFLPQKLNLNELEESQNALKKLDATVENIYKFYLPESKDERIIFEIEKMKKTDVKYPRKTGIPAKKPL
jgi:16S rRNA methyltransferase gidB